MSTEISSEKNVIVLLTQHGSCISEVEMKNFPFSTRGLDEEVLIQKMAALGWVLTSAKEILPEHGSINLYQGTLTFTFDEKSVSSVVHVAIILIQKGAVVQIWPTLSYKVAFRVSHVGMSHIEILGTLAGHSWELKTSRGAPNGGTRLYFVRDEIS